MLCGERFYHLLYQCFSTSAILKYFSANCYKTCIFASNVWLFNNQQVNFSISKPIRSGERKIRIATQLDDKTEKNTKQNYRVAECVCHDCRKCRVNKALFSKRRIISNRCNRITFRFNRHTKIFKNYAFRWHIVAKAWSNYSTFGKIQLPMYTSYKISNGWLFLNLAHLLAEWLPR